jgi:hypothetical protein
VIDPLSTPAKDISTPVNVSLPTAFEPDLFFDGDRFMRYLSVTFEMFDVMTYSVSKASTPPLKNIERMIYGIRQNLTSCRPKLKKHIMNNHIKLFICYKLDIAPDQFIIRAVYLGSQNLTHGTNMNIMYRVRDEHVQPLFEFFNLLWKNA